MREPIPRYIGLMGCGFPYAARILDWDGLPAQQADIASIGYSVWDLDAGRCRVGSAGSLAVAAAIFNSPVVDARWTVDAVGYNFRFVLPAAYLTAAHVLRVEIFFTPAGGEVYCDRFELDVQEVLGP